ncbi:MAG: CNNM domain-containing protein [Sedimentisphaerales bacterium]
MHSIFLILGFIFFVLLAGLFSGSETGLYRLSRLRLRLGIEKKKLPFVMLSRCVHDASGLLMSLLIGTNLAQYLATSIVTYILLRTLQTARYTEILVTIFIAPILFIFSELIPKNLFFYRSDVLMPYLGPFLYIFHKVLTWSGMISALKYISSLFARMTGSSTFSKTVMTSAQRHAMQAILQDTNEEGILSSVQTDIISRLVKVSNVHIKSVMIPIDKVVKTDVNSDKAELLRILEKQNFTRLLVTEEKTGTVKGYVNVYETLSSPGQFSSLEGFTLPLKHIDGETAVTDAIDFMQMQKQKILLVTRAGRGGSERTLGIVTMKDLVEELLGELAEW